MCTGWICVAVALSQNDCSMQSVVKCTKDVDEVITLRYPSGVTGRIELCWRAPRAPVDQGETCRRAEAENYTCLGLGSCFWGTGDGIYDSVAVDGHRRRRRLRRPVNVHRPLWAESCVSQEPAQGATLRPSNPGTCRLQSGSGCMVRSDSRSKAHARRSLPKNLHPTHRPKPVYVLHPEEGRSGVHDDPTPVRTDAATPALEDAPVPVEE